MLVDPDDIDVGERGSQRELFERPVGGNPELTLFETGRNVGVRFRIDVRIDAEGDSRLGSDVLIGAMVQRDAMRHLRLRITRKLMLIG